MIPAILGFTLASVQAAPGMADRWTADLRESMFPPMPDDWVEVARSVNGQEDRPVPQDFQRVPTPEGRTLIDEPVPPPRA